MENFGLYVIITQPLLSYQRVAEICIDNDIRLLQLREKDVSDRELLKIAQNIRAVTKNTATKLVINDRPDIARLSGADVLHLGQDDLPIAEAKTIVGTKIAIGLSTHSIVQAQQALLHKPFYIGFGPIFPTTTKAIPNPVVGIDKLRKVVQFATVPVVAIGGIVPNNIEQVLQAGARNIGMVRYFMQTKDLDKRIKEIKDIIQDYMGG
jgi:thiamine-phosphate pyrophosphorylase